MTDTELLRAMWQAFQAAEHVGHPDGPMHAVLSVVRAHDGDAERYRWLRDAPLCSAPVGSLIELWLFSRPTATAQAFDAAIDAARGKE